VGGGLVILAQLLCSFEIFPRRYPHFTLSGLIALMANKLKTFIDIIGTTSGTENAPPTDVDEHPHPKPARLTVWGTLIHEIGAAESDEFLRQAKQLQADSRLRKNESVSGGVGMSKVRVSRPAICLINARLCLSARSFDVEYILVRCP
jgi:hypothetical protein